MCPNFWKPPTPQEYLHNSGNLESLQSPENIEGSQTLQNLGNLENPNNFQSLKITGFTNLQMQSLTTSSNT